MYDIFSLQDFTFPEGFIWGSSTAGHQIEGDNIHSCNWQWEQGWLKNNPKAEVSGKACNSYNMVDEDIKLLKTLGHQMYRMSVEWCRIQPEEGTFDKQATEHYVKQLAKLKENGIKTCITLVHFTMPQWFFEKNGFRNLDNYKYFETYLNYIVPKISPYVDIWNIFNEFNGGVSDSAREAKFFHVLFHARAYHLIKKYSSAPISSAHAFVQFYAKRQHDLFDRRLQEWYDMMHNEFWFHAIRTGELVVPGRDGIYDKDIKDTCDYWAVNMYVRQMLDARKADPYTTAYPFVRMQMIGKKFYWEEFHPETMYTCLTRLTDKPIYVTENGISCDNDDFRIVQIAEYLAAMHAGVEAGADVKGYLHWSLMDNYEWDSYLPRFGLCDVDFAGDFHRTPKPSAYFYKDIIEHNGFSQEILRKYLKEMPRL